MNLTEADIIAIARDEFKKLLTNGIGDINKSTPEYLPTSEAWKPLGFNNPKQLLKAIENGLFRLNKEVQDRRGQHSQKARYFFNIGACLKRLNTAVEKRAK